MGMQYLHQSTYGHMGQLHTAKPIMALDKGHIYNIKNGRPDLDKPLFVVRNDHAYTTAFHPSGETSHAMFVIKGDKVHTTEYHPAHNPIAHTYEIKSSM